MRFENATRRYLQGLLPFFFRLLFPEEDTKRKYGIQEKQLAGFLSEILGVSRKELESWDLQDATGCLGNELECLLAPRFVVYACVLSDLILN